MWWEHWARLQNRAYERNKLDIRVSHESLKVQGKKRIPTPHLSVVEWQREKSGQRTITGDKRREVRAKNRQAELEKELLIYEHEHERSRSRSR